MPSGAPNTRKSCIKYATKNDQKSYSHIRQWAPIGEPIKGQPASVAIKNPKIIIRKGKQQSNCNRKNLCRRHFMKTNGHSKSKYLCKAEIIANTIATKANNNSYQTNGWRLGGFT